MLTTPSRLGTDPRPGPGCGGTGVPGSPVRGKRARSWSAWIAAGGGSEPPVVPGPASRARHPTSSPVLGRSGALMATPAGSIHQPDQVLDGGIGERGIVDVGVQLDDRHPV